LIDAARPLHGDAAGTRLQAAAEARPMAPPGRSTATPRLGHGTTSIPSRSAH